MGGTGKKGLFACLCLLLLLGVNVVLGDDEDDPPVGGDPAADGEDKTEAAPKAEETDDIELFEIKGEAKKCYTRDFGGTVEGNKSCSAGGYYCVTYWDVKHGLEYRGCASRDYALQQWGIDGLINKCRAVTGRYAIVDRYICICPKDNCNDNTFGHSEYALFRKEAEGGDVSGDGGDAGSLESGVGETLHIRAMTWTLAMTLALTLTFAAAILIY